MEHFSIDMPQETLGDAGCRLKRMRGAERHHNLRRRTQMPAGAHFGSVKPEALVEGIRAFFRALRTIS